MYNPSPYDEKAVLLAVAKGDEEAFTKIYHHYRNKIFTVAFKLIESEQAAEEIVQDVFLKVCLKRSHLKEVERFDSWLFIIARNMVYSFLRSGANNVKTLTPENVDPGFRDLSQADADRLDEKELRQVLEQAVCRLPPQQRLVYLLSKEEGLKQKDISEKMQIAPETVKKHLQYAMRSIRAYILSRTDISLAIFILWGFCNI